MKASLFESRLLAREDVAEGTAAFTFERPAGFEFRAGQSLSLTLVDPPETDAKGATRTFSIVSAPFEEGLTVATRLRDTAFKRVLGALPVGAPVRLRGPAGDFTLDEGSTRPAVFLAGGIGITPFVSLLRHADAKSTPRRITLVYACRRPQDAPYLDELLRLAERNPALRVVATMTAPEAAGPWVGERGRIDRAMLDRHLTGAAAPVHYLAGPPTMVNSLAILLRQRGATDADILIDAFYGYA